MADLAYAIHEPGQREKVGAAVKALRRAVAELHVAVLWSCDETDKELGRIHTALSTLLDDLGRAYMAPKGTYNPDDFDPEELEELCDADD